MPQVDERSLRLQAHLERQYRANAADPWWAIEHGYILTEDEKRGGETRPMPPRRYLKILLRLMQFYSLGICAKSRQLIFSWILCWFVLHETMYRKGSLNILQGKRLDDIKAIGTKSLMGRIMFIYNNLPDFLKPQVQLEEGAIQGTEGKKTLTSLVVPGGGVLIAAPQGPDIVRSKTGTNMIMDEIAFHQKGGPAWNAALPLIQDAEPVAYAENPAWLLEWNEEFPQYAQDWTAGRYMTHMWAGSTPNGHDPILYGGAPWREWRRWPELTGHKYEDGSPVEGLRVYMKKQEYEGFSLPPVCCVRMHYTADYRPVAWSRRRASRHTYDTEAAYERENEISFRSAAGKPVFDARIFTALHLRDYAPEPHRRTLVSMDTGYMGQSVCFWQETLVPAGRKYWRRSHLFHHFLRIETILDDVLQEVKALLFHWKIPIANVTFVTDWNSLNTHHGGVGIADMQIFRSHGIYPRARHVGPHQKNQAIDTSRRAFKVWSDGRPGVEIDPNGAPMVVEMLDGGWRYKEPQPGAGYVETPHKDGTNDHVGDSFVYRFWALENEIWNSTAVDVPKVENPDEAAYVKQRAMQQLRQQALQDDNDCIGPPRGW